MRGHIRIPGTPLNTNAVAQPPAANALHLAAQWRRAVAALKTRIKTGIIWVLSSAIIALCSPAAFGALSVTVTPSPKTLPSQGAAITLKVDVSSSEQQSNVRVSSALFGNQLCQVPSLSAGVTATCTGLYWVTAADVARGKVSSSIRATSDRESTGTSVPVTVSNNSSPPPAPPSDGSTTLDVSITPPANSKVGETLKIDYTLKNGGSRAYRSVVLSDEGASSNVCETQLLSPSFEMVCSAVHRLTPADVAAKRYEVKAKATASGLASPITATASVAIESTGSNPPPAPNPPANTPPPPNARVPLLGLTPISSDAWDTTAVAKVLQLFAWGGKPPNGQINSWADMSPDIAIAEMLNFKQHNWRLSVRDKDEVDDLYQVSNTLAGLSDHWSTSNAVPYDQRQYYKRDGNAVMLWSAAALARGLNPFHHKIGMWETNYHMAVNLTSQVNKPQIIRYYDDIMQRHRSGAPYHEVINTAALSAAVATQYMHRRNLWKGDECLCNEDFAREYFQLFFGILGTGDREHHETVTIKNMARALTDTRVTWNRSNGQLPDLPVHGSRYHYQGPLQILRNTITGSTTQQRLSQLSPIAINHPESKRILPETIIRDLADDNLTEAKLVQIRNAWQNMLDGNHKFLDFIRAYAISTLFHSPDRIKHWNTFDRHMIIANRLMHTNEDIYLNVYQPTWMFADEGVQVFRPKHNVFGNQTSQEAMANPFHFLKNYGRSTAEVWNYLESDKNRYNRQWERDWGRVIPRNADGQWVVSDVANWLWHYLLSDGLANYTSLERAHLHALLGSDRDLMYIVDTNDLNAVFTKAEIENDATIKNRTRQLGGLTLALGSSNQEDRRNANRRIGRAFAFIAATPYMFAQTGK